MTAPAQMTDPELRLAIAGELGRAEACIDTLEVCDTPNYTGDIAAAMRLLLDEGLCWHIDSRFEFPEVKIITEKSKNLEDPTFKAIAKDDTLEAIARAISEAAYMAMKEE